ncbi:MAG: FAD-dependent oxidoreductase, partial [Halioglobus sp.]|nr:FAD-dependent oxidoreductase [Halioglobus sp.]
GVAGVAWPSGGNQPRQIALSDDRFIPGLSALAEAVHQHGAKVAVQLHHGGLVAAEDRAHGRPMWVPSYPVVKQGDMADGFLEEELAAMFDPDAPEPSLHVMTREDIDTLVGQFAAAAVRARSAGIDGIEIHGGHGYIISDFLSPLSNQRDDEYGGSLENRARLLLDIIRAIREALGPDYPLWCKLDSGEFGQTEGISLADARATAKLAEAAGVDAITVSARHDTSMGAMHSESNIPHIPERLVANAANIKAGISIPVITSGRIEPQAADRHIGAGHFDFLGMGRKLLADPDLPNKVLAGTPEEIRPCVYCYCCVSQIYVLKPVKCAVNPETAFERERALVATSNSKHVAVVGGGPAGMEVALRLTGRGHRVTLLERGDRLGGTLEFASVAYPANERLLHWLRRQIKASAVSVQLNCTVTPELLLGMGVDEVVVATGAKRTMPDIPGNDRDFVFSGDEMRALVLGEADEGLRRKLSSTTLTLGRLGAASGITKRPVLLRQVSKVWMPLGRNVVIIGAELVGLELAEFLAERGRQVTVIDTTSRSGKGLYLVRRLRLLDELRHLGVTLLNNAQEISIDDRQVSYTNYRGQRRTLDADHVVVAKGATGNTQLAERLRERGLVTHTIGDCNGVTYIEGAMESAAELAVQIG